MSTPPMAPAGGRLTLTTIVATIGPASQSPEMIGRLIRAGVNVFRFNFSHGTREEHEARLAAVRGASREIGQPVAVLGDLPGPKIRVTKVPDPGIVLEAGQDVVIDPGMAVARGGSVPVLGCTVGGLAGTVLPGHRVLINDGVIRLLRVESAGEDPRESIRCRVTAGGLVTSGKGINFPASALEVGALTARDREWAQWAVEQDLDFLALSFVRTAGEIDGLKAILAGAAGARGRGGKAGALPIPVIAKIEKPQAVAGIEAILESADGIMVARGDLGVETDVAQVPVIQRRLIAAAGARGKPCIVATQMLESMMSSALPTRAEASDVANAVFDGADAVMLSGETAVGEHPALVVETMKRIVAAAEEWIVQSPHAPSAPGLELARGYRTAALAHAAWHAAHDWGARAVAVWSEAGGSARYLSQTGFRVPIVAFSSSESATRRMQLLRGVMAVLAAPPANLTGWQAEVDRVLTARGLAAAGDAVVLIAGLPLGERGSPNSITLHTVGGAA